MRRRVREVKRSFRSLRYLGIGFGDGPKVGYLGWVRQGNAGDDGMLQAHRNALTGIDVRDLPVGDISRVFKRIRTVGGTVRLQAVLLGGGTIFGRPDWRVHVAELCKLLPGVPWVAAGVGVEDPEFVSSRSFTSRDELRRWAELVSDWPILSVRGPRSRELLRAQGLEADVVGDPALLLGDPSAGRTPQENLLGVSLAWPEARWGGGKEPSPNVIAALKTLADDGWDIRLLVFSRWDSELSSHVAAEIGPRAHVHPARRPDDLIEAVRRCHLVVGERLHSVIFAASTLTPVVGLEYRPKIVDFMRSVGRETFVLRSDVVQRDALVELLREVAAYRDDHSIALRGPVTELRTRLLDQSDAIRGIVMRA